MSFKLLLPEFLLNNIFISFCISSAVIILLPNICFRFCAYINYIQITISTSKS
jgi:hypothetical protein